MKVQAAKFFALRVYRNNSLYDIFNTIICNRMMKFPRLVAKSNDLYSIACKIMGKSLPNFMLQNTFMRLFTAGNTLKQTDNIADFYRKQNIAVILDYCAQGSKDHSNLQVTMDNNATMFAQSAQYLVTRKNEMISIKITGLVDIPLLMRMNNAVDMIDKFWLDNSNQGKMTIGQLKNGLLKLDSTLTNQQFSNYLKRIHGTQQNLSNFIFDEVAFKMNQHPLYLERRKNYDHVVRLFFPLNVQQFSKAENLIRRLEEICDPFASNENNFKILVDAEQTYVQRAIQHLSQQLQEKFNKDKVYILPTIQNYLKRSVERTKYQIEIAQRKKLKFGAKLVRGAYIVQQTALAKEKNYENPIVPNFQATTLNYNASLQAILSKVDQTGEVVVATHNQDTIATSVQIKQKYPNSPQLMYAQLLGLADHLTFQLRDKGYRVFKYLPWAKTDVMVAYMIRRAIQLQQMRYPLDVQYDLLKHELKTRFLGN